MATAPEQDLITHLASVIGPLVSNTNLFSGKVQEKSSTIPSECVFVNPTGGEEPQAFFEDGSKIELRYSRLQVRIRSNPGEYNEGLTLARLVRDNIHHQGIAGYIDVAIVEGEPNHLSEDTTGHHDWSLNVLMRHEQARL